VSLLDEALLAFELHDAPRLQAALDAGLDPCAPLRGRTPLDWLVSMYTRSERFAGCVRLLAGRGAAALDPALAAVLQDDAEALRRALRADPRRLALRVTLPCAFTPLDGAALLHVAAEFGHLEPARALLEAGADVDARAGLDAQGLGGQTALYHVVNAHADRPAPLRALLLHAGARPDARVDGLCWGRGQDWESTWFDLTPIAYAQLGLLPQVHRDERQQAQVVRELLAAAGRSAPPLGNVPNRYLMPRPQGGSASSP
jgi:hypothetical protein